MKHIGDIVLHGVLPSVFAGISGRESQVWLKEVVFRRGETCLVEAESGVGKSSLQEMGLFPELTVMENIDIKNRLTSWKTRKDILSMLERMEIADKADEPVRRLSIGQQQRVAVVRALCQPFDFLLLVEPVSHNSDAD